MMLKLVSILGLSLFIDIIWEYNKLFNNKFEFEGDLFSLHVFWIFLTFLMIILKIIFSLKLIWLNKEAKNDKLFDIDPDNSV